MMSRKLSVGVLALLVLTNLVLGYSLLDRASAAEDAYSEVALCREKERILESLALSAPRSGSAVEAAAYLRQVLSGEVIKQRGDTVEVGNVTLIYQSGALERASARLY